MILVFDGEMSDLNADMGELLIFGFTMIDPAHPKKKHPVHTYNIVDTPEFKKDMVDDSGLLKKAVKIIEKADLLVGHYIKKHDIPFINSRLLLHGMPPLPRLPIVDTWAIAKYNLKFQSNRQANIADFLGTTPKKWVSKKDWRLTRAGHKKKIKELSSRCESDVKGARDMYLRLRPFMTNHPHLHRLADHQAKACPACHSDNFHSKGDVVTHSQLKHRWKCMESDCGYNWYTTSRKNK